MTRQLQNALKRQKQQTQQEVLQIPGSLGIPIGGQRRVEVPNRNSFVYVRLRDNQNEVIQAFNNKVAPSYGLPVIVERQGNRYIVVSVDSLRYNNNYNSFSPFLPRHGNTHSFDPESGGAGDPVFVYPRQMMPALIMPSGSDGGPNAILNAYTIKNADGTWKYVGVTGTPNITSYKPTNGQAVMVLVYLDSLSGNPYLMVGSGSYFANTITGSSAITPYIPTLTNPDHIPLAAVRLVSGTNAISWNNIYDVRQWIHTIPTGTSGGGGMPVPFALPNDITPSNLTGTYNNYNPSGGSTADVWRLNIDISSPGDKTITGIAGGTDGRILVLMNIHDANTIFLVHDSNDSSVGNKIWLGDTASSNAVLSISPGRSATLIYDSIFGYWKIFSSGDASSLFGVPLNPSLALAVQDDYILYYDAGDGYFNAKAFSASNLTGTFVGTPSSVVLTNSSGFLDTQPGLKWGFSSGRLFIQFGADVPNQDGNAGKIGYNLFSESGYLHIVGAGTGTNARNVKIYDNLFVNFINQGQYLKNTSFNSAWPYVDNTGLYVGPTNAPEHTSITGSYQFLGLDNSNTSIRFPVSLVLGREKLSTNRTYYVRTDGNDSNSGLVNTSSGAFLTIQKAWDTLSTLDLSTYAATIQIADGTYTSGLSINTMPVGGSGISILGNLTTPANVLFNITGSGIVVSVPVGITIRGMKFVCTGAGLQIQREGALVSLSTVDFGACGHHIVLTAGKLNPGTYSITGGATRHILISVNGIIEASGGTVTLTGTPAFTHFLLAQGSGSYVNYFSYSYSGAATGTRFLISLNAAVNTSGGGANFLPGNVAGTTATGGQYA